MFSRSIPVTFASHFFSTKSSWQCGIRMIWIDSDGSITTLRRSPPTANFPFRTWRWRGPRAPPWNSHRCVMCLRVWIPMPSWFIGRLQSSKCRKWTRTRQKIQVRFLFHFFSFQIFHSVVDFFLFRTGHAVQGTVPDLSERVLREQRFHSAETAGGVLRPLPLEVAPRRGRSRVLADPPDDLGVEKVSRNQQIKCSFTLFFYKFDRKTLLSCFVLLFCSIALFKVIYSTEYTAKIPFHFLFLLKKNKFPNR